MLLKDTPAKKNSYISIPASSRRFLRRLLKHRCFCMLFECAFLCAYTPGASKYEWHFGKPTRTEARTQEKVKGHTHTQLWLTTSVSLWDDANMREYATEAAGYTTSIKTHQSRTKMSVPIFCVCVPHSVSCVVTLCTLPLQTIVLIDNTTNNNKNNKKICFWFPWCLLLLAWCGHNALV